MTLQNNLWACWGLENTDCNCSKGTGLYNTEFKKVFSSIIVKNSHTYAILQVPRSQNGQTFLLQVRKPALINDCKTSCKMCAPSCPKTNLHVKCMERTLQIIKHLWCIVLFTVLESKLCWYILMKVIELGELFRELDFEIWIEQLLTIL